LNAFLEVYWCLPWWIGNNKANKWAPCNVVLIDDYKLHISWFGSFC
jgi:hypothetical protein